MAKSTAIAIGLLFKSLLLEILKLCLLSKYGKIFVERKSVFINMLLSEFTT